MFPVHKIIIFLKYLKKHDGSTGQHLIDFINTSLSINYMTAHAKFLKYIEQEKKYIFHDDATTKYYITSKGKSIIIKYDIIKYTKSFIIYFLVPIVVILTFIFQFICPPTPSTNQKAMSNHREIKDLTPDTLLEKQTSQSKSKTDTVSENHYQTSQKKPQEEKQSKEDK